MSVEYGSPRDTEPCPPPKPTPGKFEPGDRVITPCGNKAEVIGSRVKVQFATGGGYATFARSELQHDDSERTFERGDRVVTPGGNDATVLSVAGGWVWVCLPYGRPLRFKAQTLRHAT